MKETKYRIYTDFNFYFNHFQSAIWDQQREQKERRKTTETFQQCFRKVSSFVSLFLRIYEFFFCVLRKLCHFLLSSRLLFTIYFLLQPSDLRKFESAAAARLPETGNLSNYVTTLLECQNCCSIVCEQLSRVDSITSLLVKWGKRLLCVLRKKRSEQCQGAWIARKMFLVFDFFLSIPHLPCVTFTFYLISQLSMVLSPL